MSIFSFFSYILFPARCLCCQKRTGNLYLCNFCRDHLPPLKEHICPLCQERKTRHGIVCMKCHGKSPLSGVYAGFSYQDPLLKKLIHTFKYTCIQSLSLPLAERLAKRIEMSAIPLPHYIIPVPLHPLRYRWRGFNQAELLANTLSQELLPFTPLKVHPHILIRHRFTQSQAKTSTHKQRKANLKGAFSLHKKAPSLEGRTIWLVDDVSTTNSTLIEAARVLKKAGAKEIWGIVVAK